MLTFDRFSICTAWYLYLSDYHSGQWCNMYKRLSRLLTYYTPSPLLSIETAEWDVRERYEALCIRDGHKPYSLETAIGLLNRGCQVESSLVDYPFEPKIHSIQYIDEGGEQYTARLFLDETDCMMTAWEWITEHYSGYELDQVMYELFMHGHQTDPDGDRVVYEVITELPLSLTDID